MALSHYTLLPSRKCIPSHANCFSKRFRPPPLLLGSPPPHSPLRDFSFLKCEDFSEEFVQRVEESQPMPVCRN